MQKTYIPSNGTFALMFGFLKNTFVTNDGWFSVSTHLYRQPGKGSPFVEVKEIWLSNLAQSPLTRLPLMSKGGCLEENSRIGVL